MLLLFFLKETLCSNERIVLIPDERLKNLLSKIELEIKTCDPHLLGLFPVEAYMASIERYPNMPVSSIAVMTLKDTVPLS